MPVWSELAVLMLAAYVIGIGLGWALWGRVIDDEEME